MSHKAPTHLESTIASSSATTEEAEKESWVSMAMAHTELFGKRDRSLEHPCRRLELCLPCPWFFGQRTAVDANERRFPVVGEFEEPAEFGGSVVGREKDRAVDGHNRQAGGGHRLLHPYAFRSGHRRVDQFPVDEPQLDPGIAQGATKRSRLHKGCVRERQSAEGDRQCFHRHCLPSMFGADPLLALRGDEPAIKRMMSEKVIAQAYSH